MGRWSRQGVCVGRKTSFYIFFFKFRTAFEPFGKYLQTNHPFFCFPSSTPSKTEGLYPVPFLAVQDSIRLSQECLSCRIPASRQGRGAMPAALAAQHRFHLTCVWDMGEGGCFRRICRAEPLLLSPYLCCPRDCILHENGEK